MMYKIDNLIAKYGSWLFAVGLIFLPINWLITNKYLDKKSNIKRIYNPLSHIYLLFAATMQYALLVVFKKGGKSLVNL